ncbi:MAG: MAPEG family protein [Gammaproteobacteria bacterium]|nr:MAPEG family protein [Gammaproteobacteria bacterium]
MIYPMFFLVLLTFSVLLLTLRVRIRSVQRGDVALSYYSLMDGSEVPEIVTKTTRQVSNLFQVPVLFYVAGVLYLSLDISGTLPVTFAWVFVAARVLHSLIHLTYNNVLHRLVAFGIGNLAVLAMWISIISAVSA